MGNHRHLVGVYNVYCSCNNLCLGQLFLCSILEAPYIQSPVSIRTPTMDGSGTSSNICQFTEPESNFNSTASHKIVASIQTILRQHKHHW